ncbi:MAG TPA: hypothetical protein VMU85_03170 [Stellaceae bacterium]|nr:hypothetical protein [Stellaceae bacterium]
MIALASFARPAAAPEPDAPPTPLGMRALAKMAFGGTDLAPLRSTLVHRMVKEPENAAVLMDLAIIEQLFGNRDDALRLQADALTLSRIYRRPQIGGSGAPLRLLAFMAPGDFMANTPLEFLLEGSDIRLDMVYVLPGEALPEAIPEHDLAFVAIGESDENQPLLSEVEIQLRDWPKPVLNAPNRIARLSRDGACALLQGAAGVAMPRTLRIDRAGLARIGEGEMPIEDGRFPLIARPIGSHAGDGLTKLDAPAAVAAYLAAHPQREFYVARFIDYSSADGRFRKYRIALIDGKPYACHMGVSDHWMIHYLNAGMHESAEKRAQEARFMQEFDDDFARRHAPAFRALAERVDLDYFGIDCGETKDGALLIFETDVAMIVHAMDSPELFPYKKPQMRRVFDAFRDLLVKARG